MGVFSLILDKIFTDETSSLQIDFSNAVFATDKLNNIFHDAGMSILKDVDFVAETEILNLFSWSVKIPIGLTQKIRRLLIQKVTDTLTVSRKNIMIRCHF